MKKCLLVFVVILFFFYHLIPITQVNASDQDNSTFANAPAVVKPQTLYRNLPVSEGFGYSMDSIAYSWDTDPSVADGWTSVAFGGIQDFDNSSAEISIGFSFPFFENNYSNIYINSLGVLSFDGPIADAVVNQVLPTMDAPNNLIAPYWRRNVFMYENSGVFYKSDADKMTIIWHEMHVSPGSSTSSGNLTYKAILHKSGDIEFVYQDLGDLYDRFSAGIEDKYGETGLQLSGLQNESAVRITHPKRVDGIYVTTNPPFAEALVFAGKGNDAKVDLRNRSNTQRNLSINRTDDASDWLAEWFDGSSLISLGVVFEPGASRSLTLRITPPQNTPVGTKKSLRFNFLVDGIALPVSSFSIDCVIPIGFVNVHSFRSNQDGYRQISYVFPNAEIQKSTTTSYATEYSTGSAISALPNGNFIYLWEDQDAATEEQSIYYQYLDRTGNPINPSPNNLSALTSPTPGFVNRDFLAGLSVSKTGKIALIWTRRVVNPSAETFVANTWLTILDQNGGIVWAPERLTQETNNYPLSKGWYIPAYTLAKVEFGANDDLFVMVNTFVSWNYGDLNDPYNKEATLYHMVKDDYGNTLKPMTSFPKAGFSADYLSILPVPLKNGQFIVFYQEWYPLVQWQLEPQPIQTMLLNARGEAIKTLLFDQPDWNFAGFTDMEVLDDGTIVASHANGVTFMAYSEALGTITTKKSLFNADFYHPVAGQFSGMSLVSFIKAPNMNLAMTWQTYEGSLMYCLLDKDGNFITTPIILKRAKQLPAAYVATSGLGSAPLNWQPVFGVDLSTQFGMPEMEITFTPAPAAAAEQKLAETAKSPSLQAPVNPGGLVWVPLRFGNDGLDLSSGGTLAVEYPVQMVFDSGSYTGPAITVGSNQLTWTLNELEFGAGQTLYLPFSFLTPPTLGSTYKLMATITSKGNDLRPENNSSETLLVTKTYKLFLPTIKR